MDPVSPASVVIEPPGRIQAVLFDFTGVVTTSPFATMGAIGDEAGVEADVVLELMLGDYTTDSDHPWHRLERGEITIVDYAVDVQARAAAAGLELDFARLRNLMGELQVQPATVDTIGLVRTAGYRTALVTNNVKEAGEQWRDKVPLDELFEVVVDSSHVGVRKPDPAIYRLALERLGHVAPERAVFLDDHPGNVAGAHRAGLNALLVDDADPAPAMAALVELLNELR
jgi:epoxide hydrolase-like predicted phosphatase